MIFNLCIVAVNELRFCDHAIFNMKKADRALVVLEGKNTLRTFWDKVNFPGWQISHITALAWGAEAVALLSLLPTGVKLESVDFIFDLKVDFESICLS